MLVLTRKPQEKIRIGNDITITVIKTKGKTVRLGIDAPNDVTVLRGELEFDLGSKVSLEETSNHYENSSDQAEAPAEPDTRFARTTRSRIKTMLPELLGDSGPLRSMLDRRTELAS